LRGERAELRALREKLSGFIFPKGFIACCREIGVEMTAPIRLIY
jgi:hypothetical protein